MGYVANQEQTPRALEGIKGLMFLYPGGLAVATFVAMFFLYKLSDERYNQIVADLTARKNADTDKVGCL
ncbi:hypothetical protein FACS1894159_05110 [Bacteroidia bacterium]|nr:hypothetical protein FACS1894159_05110 [Bacteroidia bacterium]